MSAPTGCVGWPIPYSRVRIVALDERGGASDRDLLRGEHGMVLFKSPNLFSGFLDPVDDAHAFTVDGWLMTGDIGWMDSEGRLHLSGRAKDLIIRGGHNIDPKVIEDALGAHPAVELCAAVGAPDAYAGELPVAFVTLRPAASVTAEALREFTAASVDEGPARPRSVTILDRMPVTNVGKIYKPALRALAATQVIRTIVESVREQNPFDLIDIRPEGDNQVCIELGVATSASTEVALREALARVPFSTRLIR